jgi:hypothetical protein
MRNDQKTGTKYFGERAGELACAGAEKVKEAAAAFGEKARDTVAAGAEKAAEAATSFAEKAKDVAVSAAEKAKDTAVNVANAVGSTLSEKADAVTSAVGDGMKSMAETIREKAPQDGIIGTATSTVAKTLEAGGDYLDHQGIGGMCKDLAALVRKHPVPALFLGIGFGFLLARATTARR